MLELDGPVSATGLGTIDANGGILSIGGTLDNTGNTLAIGQNPGFGSLQFSGDAAWAEIAGGTIVNTATIGLAGAGILDNVTWQGTLVIGDDTDAVANINLLDGSGVQQAPDGGSRAVRFTGYGGNLIVGTGLIGRQDVLSDYSIVDAAISAGIEALSTLTLDAATTISIVDGTIPAGLGFTGAGPSGLAIYGPEVINQGLIEDSIASGYTLSLGGEAFVNAGTIQVSGDGNVLAVNPGSFANTGSVLVSNGATLVLDAFGIRRRQPRPVQQYRTDLAGRLEHSGGDGDVHRGPACLDRHRRRCGGAGGDARQYR